MDGKSDKIYYILIGSAILGIIVIALYLLGYFPNILHMLVLSIIISCIMLLYIMCISIFRYVSERIVRIIILPFVISIFGTSASSALAVSTVMNVAAKSTVFMIFLSSFSYCFMCCYFYKLTVHMLFKNLKP